MAIAYVGERATATRTASTNPWTISIASNATAGNTLILSYATSNTAIVVTSVTDSKGNTWTVDGTGTFSTGVGQCSTVQDVGTLTSSDTITIHSSNTSTPHDSAAVVEEFSGLATSAIVDKTAGANNASNTSVTGGTTATTTVANELVYATFSANIAATTFTAGASYSLPTTSRLAAGTTTVLAEYQIVSATGAYNPTGTINTSANVVGVTATYKIAPGPVPVISVAPAVTGTTTVGSTLTTDNGTWTNTPTSYAYQWQRDAFGNSVYSNIGAATASTYLLVDADDGCNIRSKVTATNANGNSTPANSNAVGLVIELSPTNSVAPVVSGTTVTGSALSSTQGTYAHMGGHNPTFAYLWQRATNAGFTTGVTTIGTNASTYTLTGGEVGDWIRCTVTATNSGGSIAPVSNIVGAITAPPAAGPNYRNRVIADGAINYWRLDETSGSFLDIVGGLTGAVTGTVTHSATGLITDGDAAASFSGASGNAISTVSALPPSAVTVEAWIKPTNLTATQFIAGWSNAVVQFEITTNNTARWLVRDTGASDTVFTGATNAMVAGGTYHVVGVYDAAQGLVALYINGVVSGTTNRTPTLSTFQNSGSFFIGASSPTIARFTGTIDEVAVYPFALTAGQVMAHYQAGLRPVYVSTFTALDRAGRLPQLQVSIDFDTDPTVTPRTWTDVTPDVRALTYKRAGRNNALLRSEAGTLACQLDNRSGKYDPLNSLSPYYPGIRRMRWIRVRASWAGVTYARWQGLIETWNQIWPEAGRDAVVNISATDVFKVLNLFDLAGLTFDGERTDQRIADVLMAVGITSLSLSTGVSLVDAVTTPFGLGSSALTHVLDVEAHENGLLFAEGDGSIVFQDRYFRLLHSSTPVAVIGDQAGEIPYRNGELDLDDADIWNQVAITPIGGAIQVAEDSISEAAYYTRRLNQTSLNSNTDEALSSAEYLVSIYANSAPRVAAVELIGQANTTKWPVILAAKNSDRFTWRRRAAAHTTSLDGFVERVSDTIIPGSEWRVTFEMSPATSQTFWIAGDTTLGVAGVTTRAAY